MDNFENEVTGYIKGLETQPNRLYLAHDLLNLWRKYGKDRVQDYLEELFKKGKE